MGRSCFLPLLLVSALLVLSSQGFGRKLMETVGHEDSTFQIEESAGKVREMTEVMDYGETGANTNTRGYLVSPPSQG